MERWKDRRGGGEEKRKGEKNLRERDGVDGEGTKKENKERDILIEGAIVGLERKLALQG